MLLEHDHFLAQRSGAFRHWQVHACRRSVEPGVAASRCIGRAALDEVIDRHGSDSLDREGEIGYGAYTPALR